MEDKNGSKEPTDNDKKNQDLTLFEYVKSLFENQGKQLSNGDISIEMVGNPRFLVVHLYDNKDKDMVEVTINHRPMGEFIRYDGQGYNYKFIQRYRVGIRNGRTSAEQYLEDICTFHKDKIQLQKAYH